MTGVLTEPTAGDDTTVAPRRRRPDVVAASVYLVLALIVLGGQWRHLGSGYLRYSGQDQTMWEWFFAVTAKSVASLQNPLFSDLQNAPAGVNMMANTAMLGLSVPLTPVTLAFGPTVTFALALTLGLATTAFGWYFLLSRTVIRAPLAAGLGGLIAGFAPGMISHASAHPNFTVLGVLPLLLFCLIRLGQGRNVRRHTVALGLLAAWQVLLGEEPLLIFAIAVALMLVTHTVFAPRVTLAAVRRAAGPVVVAAVLAGVLVAGPLWWQFRGPQSYSHLDHQLPGNSLLSFVAFPPQSLGGLAVPVQDVALNPTEQNAYFGIPLLVLVAACVVVLRRLPLARAAAVTILVLAVLSIGTELAITEDPVVGWAPGEWLDRTPLLESVLETRFVLAAVPLVATLVALVTDRVLAARPTGRRRRVGIWAGAVAVALVPLVPVPLPTAERTPAPTVLADGTWRSGVDGVGGVEDLDGVHGTVVTVPIPSPGNADALRWQIDAGLDYRIAGGYFVGPSGEADGEAKYGAIDRPTALLLGRVARSGEVPDVADIDRSRAREDLAYWNADVVILPDDASQADALRRTVATLLGDPGARTGDATVWDVRGVRE
ncbi:glycosyl transferase [Rhodococcoides corynebacterioides]|uniref:glycosyl transferase n=1 Tax=Rhodococcoides corynebacterioides TaxID=53972 RepID=UPI001C9A6FCF|nr:glycosyl transferase [Rhodococcus corynebacterioides]MBY6351447.1 glycosyl transferase [Rhodococcus corynebacterioides]MBY6364010.1 glycosyl transferase [Rhodococcus corynebacterioides]